MKALGAYDEKLDAQLEDLYRGRFGTRDSRGTPVPTEGDGQWDTGDVAILPDDITLDQAAPLKRGAERMGSLKLGHRLPRLPMPPKDERVHASKFVFLDVSGRGRSQGSRNPPLASSWDGAVRLATNEEALYRSWTPRYWPVESAKGKKTGLPYRDEDKDKPADFRVPP